MLDFQVCYSSWETHSMKRKVIGSIKIQPKHLWKTHLPADC